MYYRLHDTQDFSRIDYANQIKLMRCFSSEVAIKKTNILLKRKAVMNYVKIKVKGLVL